MLRIDNLSLPLGWDMPLLTATVLRRLRIPADMLQSGLLDGMKKAVARLAGRVGNYTAILCTAALANMISCNQTLGIMLTYQLCRDTENDPERLALHLEDSAVVLAPLVPWSIAGAVSLAAAGAPLTGIVAACYLYLLPLWRLLTEGLARRKGSEQAASAH